LQDKFCSLFAAKNLTAVPVTDLFFLNSSVCLASVSSTTGVSGSAERRFSRLLKNYFFNMLLVVENHPI
jgi:hypothetical protein